METRYVEQVRIYVLVLNTFGRAEESAIVAISTDYDRLVQYYKDMLLPSEERYRDEFGFMISFRDGPLKYMNPCGGLNLNELSPWGHGIHDEWVDYNSLYQLKERYNMIFSL